MRNATEYLVGLGLKIWRRVPDILPLNASVFTLRHPLHPLTHPLHTCSTQCLLHPPSLTFLQHSLVIDNHHFLQSISRKVK